MRAPPLQLQQQRQQLVESGQTSAAARMREEKISGHLVSEAKSNGEFLATTCPKPGLYV